MGNEISVASDFVGFVLSIFSHVMGYFVVGNELTAKGNIVAASITDLVHSMAQLSGQLHVLLGNHL
jgi:hypothetical protein